MTATADTAIWPASLTDLERAAKRYVETDYASADNPGHDMRSVAVLAPSGMAGPLIVPLPSQEDVKRKRLVHCCLLPGLVRGLEAAAVVVGHPAWTAPDTTAAPSEHPQRGEVVILTGASLDEGGFASQAKVTRTPGQPPQLGAWRDHRGVRCEGWVVL